MSASGLGATDFLGKQGTFGGVAKDFYAGIAKAYGKDFGRSFEPHVGRKVFEQLLAEAGVEVVYGEKLDRTSGKGVTMDGTPERKQAALVPAPPWWTAAAHLGRSHSCDTPLVTSMFSSAHASTAAASGLVESSLSRPRRKSSLPVDPAKTMPRLPMPYSARTASSVMYPPLSCATTRSNPR